MAYRKGADQINVYMVEPGFGYWELLDRCSDMALDLGTLALEALAGPLHDVLTEAVPDELAGHNLERGSGSRMTKFMYRFKNLAFPGFGVITWNIWHYWSGPTSLDITEEAETSIKLEVLEN